MNRTFSGFHNWSVKLIIINTAVYFLYFSGGSEILQQCGLIPASVLEGKIWQPVTYMFLHRDLSHLFFNMYALLIFGIPVEQIWGSRRFLVFYFFTGIGAGLTIFVINGFVLSGTAAYTPTIGASGAIFGVLAAFGFLFPESRILLFFFIPVRARVLVILYGAVTFGALVSGGESTVSHAGHLGGLIFAFVYFLICRKNIRPAGSLPAKFMMKQEAAKQDALPEQKTENFSPLAEKLMKGGPELLSDDEFQEARYLTIMTDTEKTGMCEDREFGLKNSRCMECEFYRECCIREIKKRMPGDQA